MKRSTNLTYMAAFLLLTATGLVVASDTSYTKLVCNGIPAHVVYVNMESPNIHVTPALARNGTGSQESFGSMVNRLHPVAAVTGTFFCTRSLQPTGDIVIEGRHLYYGCVGTAICVDADGKVEFRSIKAGRSTGWSGYQSVVCAGPSLVRNGKMAVDPRSEGFRDPSLFQRKRRAAVGLTNYKRLVLVTVEKPVYLSDLARIMLYIEATDALDLDGGSSTALYYRGKTVTKPGRLLTNLLVVYDSADQYAQYRTQLAPNMPRIVARSKAQTPRTPPVLTDREQLAALAGLTSKPIRPAVTDAVQWLADAAVMKSDQEQGITSRPSNVEASTTW